MSNIERGILNDEVGAWRVEDPVLRVACPVEVGRIEDPVIFDGPSLITVNHPERVK